MSHEHVPFDPVDIGNERIIVCQLCGALRKGPILGTLSEWTIGDESLVTDPDMVALRTERHR